MKAWFEYELTFIPCQPPSMVVAQMSPEDVEISRDGLIQIGDSPWWIMSAN